MPQAPKIHAVIDTIQDNIMEWYPQSSNNAQAKWSIKTYSWNEKTVSWILQSALPGGAMKFWWVRLFDPNSERCVDIPG